MHSIDHSVRQFSEATTAGDDTEPQPDQNTAQAFDVGHIANEIASVLQTHYHQVGGYLSPEGIPQISFSQSGRLYADITQLVTIAQGAYTRQHTSDAEFQAVGATVQRLLDLLFMPPGGSNTAPIPGTFWTTTATGKLLVRVLSWMERDDLVSSLVTRSLYAESQASTLQAEKPSLQLRGKHLPVSFAKGLMGAMIDIFGYGGGTPDLLRISVADLLPDLQTWRNWFPLVAERNPLCAYYRSDLGTPEPVDYVFLERTRQAISALYPTGHSYLSHQLGWSWWAIDYPLARRWYSSYSLQHLIGASIVQTLQQATLQPPPIHPVSDARFLWAEEQRVRTACRQLIHTLQCDGNIMCTLTERKNVMLMRFSQCPFCHNALTECSVLLGLVERMVLWMYGKRQADMPTSMQRSLCIDLTDGLLDVRPVGNDTHTVAIIFAPQRAMRRQQKHDES